jgi:hypothetical protein
MTFEQIAEELNMTVSMTIRAYNSGIRKLALAADADPDFRQYLISALSPPIETEYTQEFMRILDAAEEKECLHQWYDCSIIGSLKEYEDYKG